MAGLDDTDNEEASVDKHLAGMRTRMAAAKEDDTDEVSVETPEADDDDEETETEVATTRRERRANRMTARERAAAAEAEAKVLREQLAERSRPVPGARETVANTADVDRRIRDTYKELEKLESEYQHALSNKTLTPEREAQLRERAQELDIQKLELAAERRETRVAPERRQKDLSEQLARDNADVYQNPRAARYAYGRAQQLIAMGRADDKALHDEVMLETRSVVLGIREKPGAIERQRPTGMSSGPRTAPSAASKTIPMPKGSHYYKMAVAMFPSLDAGAACQKWAQTVGKKLLNKG
jgi:hypothetical protein